MDNSKSTESYDQMDPIGVDPRWEIFAVFHDYLVKSFPLVYVVIWIITIAKLTLSIGIRPLN